MGYDFLRIMIMTSFELLVEEQRFLARQMENQILYYGNKINNLYRYCITIFLFFFTLFIGIWVDSNSTISTSALLGLFLFIIMAVIISKDYLHISHNQYDSLISSEQINIVNLFEEKGKIHHRTVIRKRDKILDELYEKVQILEVLTFHIKNSMLYLFGFGLITVVVYGSFVYWSEEHFLYHKWILFIIIEIYLIYSVISSYKNKVKIIETIKE